MPHLVLAVLVALLPMPVLAQAGPSFDCAMAASSAEEAICATPSLAAADRRLAEIYGAALIVAGGLDAGADEAVATLKAMQRGWIKGRDDCWKAADVNGCIADAYARREGELVATWMLDEPSDLRRFQCGDNPANEISVFYFDLPTPAVRVEYGDGIDAMVLSAAASGSRYDGSFGNMFWEKGAEALFTWTDGAEQTCLAID